MPAAAVLLCCVCSPPPLPPPFPPPFAFWCCITCGSWLTLACSAPLSVRLAVHGPHNDNTLSSGPNRARQLLRPGPWVEDILSHRYAVMNVWRRWDGGNDEPLAVCSGDSLSPDNSDMQASDLVYQNRTGEIYSAIKNRNQTVRPCNVQGAAAALAPPGRCCRRRRSSCGPVLPPPLLPPPLLPPPLPLRPPPPPLSSPPILSHPPLPAPAPRPAAV